MSIIYSNNLIKNCYFLGTFSMGYKICWNFGVWILRKLAGESYLKSYMAIYISAQAQSEPINVLLYAAFLGIYLQKHLHAC